jgi:cell wall-associated NlpC family hydrolase
VRARSAALIACTLIATIVPLSAVAEQGIAPGSGAVVTAGAPLVVRATPGWDAEVSYEIADGSYVTVWDVAQTAPDGTLWYPVDGGFVPVDAVTSLGALEGGVALYQEAETEEWVEPAASEGWVDPNTGEWVQPAAEEWVDPAATEYVEPAAEAWVEPVAQEGWVDPNTGEWVEPATQAQEGWVDASTGEWVEPAAAETGATDPSAGEWVEPTATETGWTDPNTGEWVEPAAEEVAAPAEEWVEPAPTEMVSTNTGGPEAWGEPIGTAYISGSSGDGAVCRAGADRGTDRLAVLAEGEAVEVRGEAVGEWQPVNCAGIGGYVNSSLISWEPVAAPLADTGRRGNRGNAGNSGTANSSGTNGSSGNQVANFAMQYVGYPYAYAGEGPYAFDCSGFTKFVIQNTLGMDITHDMFTQIGMGQSVGMNELQPGDLVFFANTFRPGLSHTGIYIGGGQFVHAENEGTGVVVSDLNSDYYGSRWAGGTRIA